MSKKPETIQEIIDYLEGSINECTLLLNNPNVDANYSLSYETQIILMHGLLGYIRDGNFASAALAYYSDRSKEILSKGLAV